MPAPHNGERHRRNQVGWVSRPRVYGRREMPAAAFVWIWSFRNPCEFRADLFNGRLAEGHTSRIATMPRSEHLRRPATAGAMVVAWSVNAKGSLPTRPRIPLAENGRTIEVSMPKSTKKLLIYLDQNFISEI